MESRPISFFFHADPLANIRTTGRNAAFVANNRLFEPQKLLDEVLVSANSSN